MDGLSAKADRFPWAIPYREPWRPGPESNRGTRICNPLRSLSATRPGSRRCANRWRRTLQAEAALGQRGAGAPNSRLKKAR